MKKLICLAGLFLVQGCPLTVMCSENGLHSSNQNFAAPRTGADILETLKYFKESSEPIGQEFYTFINETVPKYHNLLDDESFSQVFVEIRAILAAEEIERFNSEQISIIITIAMNNILRKTSDQGYWERVLRIHGLPIPTKQG